MNVRLVGAPKRFGDHHNAFGFLRLVFASLVIVSHTPELVDGNRSRELLSQVSRLSFGEFAVNGFFVVSGFLITGSVLKSTSDGSYLLKRIARIYPAFALMSAICVFVVAPLVGGRIVPDPLSALPRIVGQMLILFAPETQGEFAGSHYPFLNGAAWTLQYEFFCYLLILLAKQVGLLRSATLTAAAALACHIAYIVLIRYAAHPFDAIGLGRYMLGSSIVTMPRLVGLFLTGSAVYLAQDRFRPSVAGAAAALVVLMVFMRFQALAQLGFALGGTYLIFAVASWGAGTPMARINNRNDISYGLYLYAWPIEKLLLWWRVSDNLLVLGALTWLLAAGAGALSWFLLEKPVMRRVRPRAPAPGAARVAEVI